MGSCLSPLIVEIFMKTFEKNLESAPIFPRIWLRYVDDIFAIIKKDKIDEALTWLNSHHANIQFTVEIEQNGKLSFLDVMVERNNNQLEFDIYPILQGLKELLIHHFRFTSSSKSKICCLPFDGTSVM
jgi:hypothetical protein